MTPSGVIFFISKTPPDTFPNARKDYHEGGDKVLQYFVPERSFDIDLKTQVFKRGWKPRA